MKKLPDAEFEIMKAIWKNTSSVTSKDIISALDDSTKWKPQTVLTLLARLTERGFISSEKHGKERWYEPIVSEEEYLTYETQDFMKRFHKNSFASLFSAFYKGKSLNDQDLNELMAWIKERK